MSPEFDFILKDVTLWDALYHSKKIRLMLEMSFEEIHLNIN